MLDTLLGSKLGLAEQNGIQVDCSFRVPDSCEITDIDFCIMLSNALDNAVYACGNVDNRATRYLKLSGSRQGDFFLIQVENSCPAFENTEVEYGIGLTNIKAAAEKYHGILSIDHENIEKKTGLYRLCILLFAFHTE